MKGKGYLWNFDRPLYSKLCSLSNWRDFVLNFRQVKVKDICKLMAGLSRLENNWWWRKLAPKLTYLYGKSAAF
jgi:hypothetical protein